MKVSRPGACVPALQLRLAMLVESAEADLGECVTVQRLGAKHWHISAFSHLDKIKKLTKTKYPSQVFSFIYC